MSRAGTAARRPKAQPANAAARVAPVLPGSSQALPKDLRERLLTLRGSRLCLADWGLIFGPELYRVQPLLAKCIGEMAKSYPTPETGLRLRVDPREVGFLAHPVGDFDHDAEDLTLTEKEVQLWQLNWAMVESEFGEGKGRDLVEGKLIARVIGDFQRIVLPSGLVLALHKKQKRRAFLRAAHEWCEQNKTDVFEWQTVIDDYNARFEDLNLKRRKITSERIDDDLFKGQKVEFDELFGEPDRANGRLQFKVKLVLARK
jgi:hypothetical protein